MRRCLQSMCFGMVLCLVGTHAHAGQGPSLNESSSGTTALLLDEPRAQSEERDTSLRRLPARFFKDQQIIWTSPGRARRSDLIWLVPFAAATGVGIASDHHVMKDVISHDASFNQANVNTSNVLTGVLLAAPVAFYGGGVLRDSSHARETGVLGAEAILDGLVVQQGLKLVTWRERPSQDNARGLFYQSRAGFDSSFPSSHSLLAWSSAAVIASEYPSFWTQVGVYSAATGVSLTRVLGQEHFPTDMLVGSAAGWLVGRYVYRAHHHHGTGHAR